MYEEGVLYSLDDSETARKMNRAGSAPDPALVSLMLPERPSVDDDPVNLLQFLQNMHPAEWENFRERIARMAEPRQPWGTKWDPRDVEVQHFLSDEGCMPGDLAKYAVDLQLWASCRSQVRA